MTDAADIELLDNLAMRFAMANSDDKLQKLVTTLLVPLLDKLDSASASVRAKIISLLGQINRKLKSNPGILLPIDDLARSTFSQQATGYLQSFKLMYVPMAIERADTQQLVEIIPKIADSMQGRPSQQTTVLVNALFVAVLRVPRMSDDRLKTLGFSSASLHRSLAFLRYSADLLMLNPMQPGSQGTHMPIPAGLSTASQLTVTNEGKASWASDPKALETLKLSLLHIISSDLAFPTDMPSIVHEQRLLALTCASCDPFFPRVASDGKDSTKRLRPIDFDSKTFVGAAFAMVLGSGADTSKRSPVSIAARLKLFSFLNKSETAASIFPQCVEVVTATLFGSDITSNLRRQGMVFLQWVIRMAPQPQLDKHSNDLLQQIRRVLDDDTGSESATLMSDDIIRGTAFVAWGNLAKRAPSLVADSLDSLQTLFASFDTETASVHLSVQEALLAMLPAYKSGQLSKETEHELLGFLSRQIKSATHQARYCALRYAISAFPFALMEARWLCIQSLSDSKHEIRALAQSGLMLPSLLSTSSNDSGGLPAIAEAVHFLSTRAGRSLHSLVYSGVVDFVRSLLLATGLLQISEQHNSPSSEIAAYLKNFSDLDLGSQQLTSQPLRHAMRLALRDLDQGSSEIDRPISNLWMGIIMLSLTDAKLSESSALVRSLGCLVELLSLGMPTESLAFFDKRHILLPLLESRDSVVQQYAVQALASVFAVKLRDEGLSGNQLNSVFWNDQVAVFINGLLATSEQADQPKLADKVYGSILAMSYIGFGLTAARKSLKRSWTELGLLDLGNAIENARTFVDRRVQAAGKTAAFPSIAISLCMAIGAYGMADLAESSLVDQSGEPSSASVATMSAVVNIGKMANTIKQQDAAFDGLSRIVIGTPDIAALFVESMRTLARSVTKKQLDLHFRIGRAIAMAIGRFECTLVELGWQFPFDPSLVYTKTQLSANALALDPLLEVITSSLAVSTNLQDRQAAVVWTVSLVQMCPQLPQLTTWLPRLHSCVCAMLSDRDDFTRELASNALALIYDRGDVLSREDMMTSLKKMFGTSNDQPADATGLAIERQAAGQQHASDTQMRIVNSTYKSLLSLATDMRNPALFYPLVQLATQVPTTSSGSGDSTTLSGKYGAAYGLAVNVERACEAVQPYIRPIIPKLFRHTFDPNPQTQAAMKGIWHALIKFRPMLKTANTASSDSGRTTGNDSSEAGMMDIFWDLIIEECLSSMGQFEWQVRESGCNALVSALSGSSPERIMPYLERIWQMSFRALDDIKATVRDSGLKACQSLANSTVAWCTPRTPSSPKHDEQARSIMAIVMPYLVDKGIPSDSEDVCKFSLGLTLKLCRTSGSYLSPSVPAITERMLESLSNMEPQAANYLTFHTGEHNMSPEQLESLRLGAVKSSPIMQGIEQALEYITADGMAELVPRLQNIVRHGVGLATRAGCARAIAVLCVKQAALVEPHAGSLVKAISGSLTESSAIQRQAWAAAIGYMAAMLTPGMMRNLFKHLEKTYFGRYESDIRGVSGQVLQQLARNCPEKLSQYGAEPGSMSFVLFGCSDTDELVAETFDSAWQEIASAAGTGIIDEHLLSLLALPLKHIADDRWSCRIQSAKAISGIVDILVRVSNKRTTAAAAAAADAPSESLEKLTQATLPELIRSSQGTMWPGKEHVLGCLVRVCATNAQLPDDTFAAVCDILIKQMSYGSVSYQRSVVGHYITLVSALNPENIYGNVSDALLGIVQQDTLSRTSAMDVDADEPMQQPQKLLLIASATKALVLSLPRTRQLSDDEFDQLAVVLQNNARNSVWNVRVASLEAFSKLFEHSTKHGGLMGHSDVTLEAIKVCTAEGKYLAVRVAALDALDAFITSVQAMTTDAAKKWRLEAFGVLDLLTEDPAPSIADRAKELRRQ